MLNPNPRRNRKSYSFDQCALYKVGSKKRLAKILNCSQDALLTIAESNENYYFKLIPEEVCRFTGRIKKAREAQVPKAPLRIIHERILKLLKFVVAPPYSHATTKGLSYRSNASAHSSSVQVITFDIRKFYPSTSCSNIYNFFADQLQCAPDVAKLLTKLVSFNYGLPTGSPLSPILSLYANKPLFDGLNFYAEKNDLVFTCYIDDLTFSGEKIPKDINYFVSQEVRKYGHTLSREKTKLFRRSQAKHITGVVVFGGRIEVPHIRFMKARAVARAMCNANTPEAKFDLAKIYAGLLSEMSYLDSRYSPLAKRAQSDLKALTEQIERDRAEAPF